MILSTTEYTKKVYADFASFNVKKNKSMIIVYVCSVIIIFCGIISLILNDYTYGILNLCLGVLFALYGVIIRFLIINTNKKNFNTINVYVFEDDYFTLTVRDKFGKEVGVSKINYEALHSVKTYKNYAYVYINKVSCYILIKENFESEEQFNSVVSNISSHIIGQSNKNTIIKNENEELRTIEENKSDNNNN